MRKLKRKAFNSIMLTLCETIRHVIITCCIVFLVGFVAFNTNINYEGAKIQKSVEKTGNSWIKKSLEYGKDAIKFVKAF